jgi:predicted aspartyl protease
MYFRFSIFILLLAGFLAGISACQESLFSSVDSAPPEPAPASETVTASPGETTPSPETAPPSAAETYQQAIAKASSAFTMSQSAQSQDDWRLVTSRWQQAIDLMAGIPAATPQHQIAQQKLTEYRRNLAYAEQQANRSPLATNSDGVVRVREAQADSPSNARSTAANPGQIAASQTSGGRVFYAPIVRRAGGTPVIRVTFNGNQQFDMIVDTGASGTLITQSMAAALRFVPTAKAEIDTASAQNVSFPIGYIDSIEVDGAIARNVLVAVAGSEMDIGLLGHDFFGNFDVTIRQDVVEFRER